MTTSLISLAQKVNSLQSRLTSTSGERDKLREFVITLAGDDETPEVIQKKARRVLNKSFA